MAKSFRITFAAALLAAGLACASASTELPPPSKAPDNLSGLHDFDFLAGHWRAHHRVLKERLAGSHDWMEFDGTCDAWTVMNGAGNVDDNFLNKPTGAYRAVTIRSYDPKTAQWAIWWLDGRDPHGNLDPAVKGRFVNGEGVFYANDKFKGKPVLVRIVWSHITRTSIHWEQAFSPDGGKTWETNWISDFQRVAQ
jgi:hypothetical protein